MPKAFKSEEVIEILDGASSKEWNESISSRLESIRAYLDQDEWKKGLSPFLKAVMGNGIAKILNESCEEKQYHYTRGFIAALRMVISIPSSVEVQINSADTHQKQGKPDATSGY